MIVMIILISFQLISAVHYHIKQNYQEAIYNLLWAILGMLIILNIND